MKKGFTLAEMLSVIVIIGIIAVIIVPAATKILSSHKSTLLDVQLNNIEAAAKAWGADNIYLLPSGNDLNIVKTYEEVKDGTDDKYGILIIDLGLLKQGGYISDEIINPVTNKEFNNDLQIKIINSSNKIIYEAQMS